MKAIWGLVLTLILTVPVGVQAKNYCGDLNNAFGPFDYRKRTEYPNEFNLVESAHFPPDVENLIIGNSSTLGGDIDYTLRAIPNHHRALASLAKLGLRHKATKVAGLKWSVECYFNRGMRFQPDDAGVRSVYGSYLYKLGRIDEAIEHLSEAVRLDPENGTAHYNLGLLYLQKKNYVKARIYGKKAESLGFPLAGLKSKLTELGRWESAVE
jgi:tetratricopeptide (TPR) repeat protein